MHTQTEHAQKSRAEFKCKHLHVRRTLCVRQTLGRTERQLPAVTQLDAFACVTQQFP